MSDLQALYTKQYKDNIQLDLQQIESKIREYVDVASDYKGEGAAPIETIGTVEMQEVTDRFGDTPWMVPTHTGRWVVPVHYEVGIPVPRVDLLQTLGDPRNKYQLATRGAYGRKIDDVVLSATFGTARVGKDGGQTEAFDAANQEIAAATGPTVGLNIDKIAAGLELLMTAEIDTDAEPITVGISPRQWRDLMSLSQVTSSDYVMEKTLLTGKLPNLFGVNFIVSNRIKKVGNTWQCPMWARSGIHLGIWADYDADVSQRKDKRNTWQVYATGSVGATRTHKRKVVRLLCQ